MSECFTVLPRNTGIRGTSMLGFDLTAGAWADGRPLLFRGTREVPLGTNFIAVVPLLQHGFKRRGGGGKYEVAPSGASALASPLCRNPAWWRTMFLPLADPATGALAFTFFARSSERMKLIQQLIAATRQRMALGVRALPVVELARESYRFSDTLPVITPEPSARAAALCPSDAPDPPDGVPDDMDLYHPALPIVAWIDLSNPSAAGPHRRLHTDELTPAMIEILARLPDAKLAVRLAHRYLFAPARASGPIRLHFIAAQTNRVDKWVEIRRDVPALNALSDEELNATCNVAFAIEKMDDDEYFYFAEMFRLENTSITPTE